MLPLSSLPHQENPSCKYCTLVWYFTQPPNPAPSWHLTGSKDAADSYWSTTFSVFPARNYWFSARVWHVLQRTLLCQFSVPCGCKRSLSTYLPCSCLTVTALVAVSHILWFSGPDVIELVSVRACISCSSYCSELISERRRGNASRYPTINTDYIDYNPTFVRFC